MANSLRYFVGNWKMFGVPSSYRIIEKIHHYLKKDKKNNKKYKIVIAPPFTLLQEFSKKFKNKKIIISSQNCYHQDLFGSYTGKVSPFMIKRLGVNYTLLGHSECRSAGETDEILKKKMLDTFVDINDVFLVVDDRDKVVKMWRDLGLNTFQVAPGDF